MTSQDYGLGHRDPSGRMTTWDVAVTSWAITGGTGTLGRELVSQLLADLTVTRVVALSRDEVKQSQLAHDVPDPRLRCFIGDVRDERRLVRAFRGCQVVVHAAALKQVQQSTYSPRELVKTNVLGALNVVDAALEAGCQRVILVSSDKACQATNLYGSTKFTAETCGIQDNADTWPQGMAVVAVRYGNVFGSRGSVAHYWERQGSSGKPFTVTHPGMTRFWMTVGEAAQFVRRAAVEAQPGVVMIPKLPSVLMIDVLRAVLGKDYHGITVTGLRPGGEKLHEALLSEEERSRTQDAGDCFHLFPAMASWATLGKVGDPVPEELVYTSDQAPFGWIHLDAIRWEVERWRRS